MLLSDTAIAILATFLAFLSHRIESLLSYTPVWHRFHFRGLSFIVTFWSHGFLSVVCFQSTFGHSKYSFFHMNFRTIYSNSAMFVLFFLTGSTADGIKQLTSLSYWAILLKKKAWALIYKVFYSLPLSLFLRWVYTFMGVHVSVCVQGLWAYMRVEVRRQLRVLPLMLCIFLFEAGSHWPEIHQLDQAGSSKPCLASLANYTRLSDWPAGLWDLHLSNTGVPSTYHCVSGGLNSGPYACKASPVPAEPLPMPSSLFFTEVLGFS